LLEGGDSASSFGGESPATVQITVRKDTNDNWVANNPILAAGEIGYNNEDKQLFVGDGVTAYQDFTNEHYIVHWDDFESALNSFDGRFTSIESNVTALQSDVSTLQSNLESSNTFISQLQEGLNDAVADISSLQSDISSEASTRSTAVTSLQGQIDAIIGGVMKRLTIQFNASDVPSIEGAPFDIITPTSGKTLQIISACVSVVSTVPSSKSLDYTFNNGATYANPIQTISVLDDVNATTNGLVNSGLPYFAIDQPLDLLLTNGGVQAGDAQFTLTIFYMEV
jgi:hypothetical protein